MHVMINPITIQDRRNGCRCVSIPIGGPTTIPVRTPTVNKALATAGERPWPEIRNG